jgi:hypothetical protein
MPEDRRHEQPKKRKEARGGKKIVGNVKPPEKPEKGRSLQTYEHG